jgi:hypothetical protein
MLGLLAGEKLKGNVFNIAKNVLGNFSIFGKLMRSIKEHIFK